MKSHKPYVVSIASGKGGVGKTFLAANLAACLAEKGKKTLVVDCDLGLANMDIVLGVVPEFNLCDVVSGDRTAKEVIVTTKAGFDLLPASSGVQEMGQLAYQKIGKLKAALDVIIQDYDQVILDTGAGISEVVLQLNLYAPKNVIVLNREPTSLTDAYAVVKVMSQRFDRRAFGIIVNWAADKKEGDRIFGHMDGVTQQFLGLPLHYLGQVLYDQAVPASIVKQNVLVNEHPDSPVAKDCYRIAGALQLW